MKKTRTIPAAVNSVRYRTVDSHLHALDFLQQTEGFAALADVMDEAGVEQAVVFGMPMAKQWDSTMPKAPSYYLSNDSRCYYYSGTDYILAELLKKQPAKIRKRFYPFCCGINGNDRMAAAQLRRLLEMYPDLNHSTAQYARHV